MDDRRKEQVKTDFLTLFRKEVIGGFNGSVSDGGGEWVVKGFIDIARNIYTISTDTKVISKVMELLIFPTLCAFAERNDYKIALCREQNFYPDMTFIDPQGHKYAVDVKSTYRKDDKTVNGMTLGAFTGYFRDRKSTKNVTFPYADYTGHFVLGIIYSRADEEIDERRVYTLDELRRIPSVVKNFECFMQEKFAIATDRPGSGNTKNIGGVTSIEQLKSGKGPFAELGENVFDDYWTHYLTSDMARSAELGGPLYKNLKQYKEFKNITP